MFPGMMPWASQTPPEAPKKPLGDPSRPVACVKRTMHAAWCGREAPTGEYLFGDADYAVEHYSNRKTPGLHVCADCEIAIKYSS